MKRILLLTADAGLGHRSATDAIATALQDQHGGDCEIAVANPLDDERVPAVLRDSQTDYDRVVRESPHLYELGYQVSDAAVPGLVIEGALTVMLYVVVRDLVWDHRPDVVVTTYPLYQAPLGAVKAIEGWQVPLVTVVTDLVTVHRVWFSQASDMCVVPTEAAREIALEYGLLEPCVKVLGIPVDPALDRKDRSRSFIRTELGWEQDLPTLLVVGGKRVGHLEDILRVVNHSGLQVQMALVSGRDKETQLAFQEVDWHLPTHVYGFVENMPTLMHAADGILCKAGGLIVSEALACGLPLLLVDVLPGQEAGNADYVTEEKAGDLIPDPVSALETIYHWLDGTGQLLAERAHNAQRLGRPRAAYEIAEQVWALVERGPDGESDARARERTGLIELLTRSGVPWQADGGS
jgi:1,2-diacylglycerol 3-beta-galactosyltransferase